MSRFERLDGPARCRRVDTRMWCGTCQSDVVTEVASDHRRVSCSICGATLGETAASQNPGEGSSPRSAKTSQAKDLLDRWAKSPLFDPYGPARTSEAGEPASALAESDSTSDQAIPGESPTEPGPKEPASIEPASAQSAPGNAQELDRLTEEILSRVARITDSIRQPDADSPASGAEATSGESADAENAAAGTAPVESHIQPDENRDESAWRIDSGHTAGSATESGRSFDAAGNPVTPGTGQPTAEPARPRIDVAHPEAAIPAPHAEFSQPAPAALSNPPQKSGFVGGIGQVLAYLGILGLTAGTSLVIVGYFGGPAHYAPTGWLITTIGQMMLFLGVVTLVSTGMEQTQVEVRESLDETLREVSSRIDQLGQRLTRIDAAAHETPPAPHSLTPAPSPQESSSAQRD